VLVHDFESATAPRTRHRIGGVSSVVTGNDVDGDWVVSEGEVVFPLTSAMAKRVVQVRLCEEVNQ
jgi:hypothetical protein